MDASATEGTALFHETQRFTSNPWALAGLAGAAIGCGSIFLATGALGDLSHPAGWVGLAVGLGVMGLLGVGGLRTEVRPDGLYVRMIPLTREHRFDWSEIASAEARRYRPIREYGGWGVRWGGGGKAYNVHGDHGVQLVFRDGRRLLIGSQRAEALARAIAAARGA